MLGESVRLRCPQNELLLRWISNAAVMIKKKELLNKGFAPNVLLEAAKSRKASTSNCTISQRHMAGRQALPPLVKLEDNRYHSKHTPV
jgi:hypothetical protein